MIDLPMIDLPMLVAQAVTPAKSTQEFAYHVEGGSLAGKESSDEISTISRSSSPRTEGAAKAQSSMAQPAAPHPVSQSERGRVPVATMAVPTTAQSNLEA